MNILKTTLSRFVGDQCSTLAASLAYYTIFALPPLLYVLLTILTFGMSVAYQPEQAKVKARELIQKQSSQLIGNEAAAEEIATILEENQAMGGIWWKTLISLIGILFGATGVVVAMQTSLNRVWRVQPDPEQGGVKTFLKKRILSLGMILCLGFLLLVSMVVSTVLSAVGSQVSETIGFQHSYVSTINDVVVFLITLLLFAAILRFMPDADVGWRDVMIGAFATAVLFYIGRFLMGLYFSNTAPGAKLGSAAASLAVLLVWVYYSAMIFLLGAEFTQAWAISHGRRFHPEKGAVRVEPKIIREERIIAT